MHPMLNIAVRAARAAGNVIARNIDRVDSIKISKKQRNDFVTEIDQQAEDQIVKVLRKAYPDHALLCEESGLIGQRNSEYQWIIDPLDGTTNFMRGVPWVCVSIALKHKNRLEQGVIYNPISQELYTATRGDGAWLNSKRIRVSNHSALSNALIGTSYPHRLDFDIDTYMKRYRRMTALSIGVRRHGSAALELAAVAAGRFDGFWGNELQPWDVAAGGLLIREAGGLICDFEGQDTWLDSGELVAATPRLLPHLLKELRVN